MNTKILLIFDFDQTLIKIDAGSHVTKWSDNLFYTYKVDYGKNPLQKNDIVDHNLVSYLKELAKSKKYIITINSATNQTKLDLLVNELFDNNIFDYVLSNETFMELLCESGDDLYTIDSENSSYIHHTESDTKTKNPCISYIMDKYNHDKSNTIFFDDSKVLTDDAKRILNYVEHCIKPLDYNTLKNIINKYNFK